MSASRIARRYSKALIAICDKDSSHEHVARDLDKVVTALGENGEVHEALLNPAVGIAVKSKVLESISKSLVLRPSAQNFLQFLNDKQRLDELEGILEDFRDRLDELSGRVRALVTSAKPLSTLESQRIKTALEKSTGKKVVLETATDPSLLGGVVTRVGNTVLDGSVQSALNQMRTQLFQAVQ